MTHYEVLGVAPDASAAAVRQAYVRLARQHHPDFFAAVDGRRREEAERRMRAINQAWSTLGTEESRRLYDRAQGIGGGAGALDSEESTFRPFDDGDDDIDPRDLPDEPYVGASPSTPAARALTLVPVLAFATSVGLLALGMVVKSIALLGLSVAAFLLACFGFVVLPLVALSRASRDD